MEIEIKNERVYWKRGGKTKMADIDELIDAYEKYEVIPIDWIEYYASREWDKLSDYHWVITKMIEDWREEND